MARFGEGLAADDDLVRAAEAAAVAARIPLGSHNPDLAMVFVAGDDPEEIAAALQRAAAAVHARTVIGCSASGVIGAGRAVERGRAVSVWAGLLPRVRVRAFHLEVIRTPQGMAVLGLPPLDFADSVGILLADPYSFPADGFVEQSNEAFGLPLSGGLAHGPRGPGSTRLLLDRRPIERGAVGVVLGGDVGARAAVSQGCRPIGPPMTVTNASGNVLLELAGVPAARKLEQVLASLSPEDQALATAGLQIGVAMDEYADEHDMGDFLVRGIVGLDAGRSGLVIGDIVSVGRTVRFHVRDAASADDDLRATAKRVQEDFPVVHSVLLFSCNGRGSAMFADPAHDVTTLRHILRTDVVSGFFAAGEIGPVGGSNHVHGFSASMVAFGDPYEESDGAFDED
ncbi:MAG: FIST C-terminal domain-containing protein [Acidothermus sp.]|nr:FIST C-terminal domain-containing protein [Acidothermus sp.]MCL6537890.1 FIST C-terminal domain-containing protein [Acidothermus sp.]